MIKKKLIHPVKRRIAKYYLSFLRKFFGLKVIGITGSAGKTTTKEMLASTLKLKGRTVWSHANIDPVYNIPTTILKCTPWSKYLILEMGVEYPNEMDFYLWLAKPNIGVITNIYQTHTEFLEDVEGVAEEKGKLLTALGELNFAVLNKEDLKLRKMVEGAKAKIIWFGERGDVRARDVVLNEGGTTEFILNIGPKKFKAKIPILGEQFVENALAAAAVARVLGVSAKLIIQGLANFQRQEHRMNVFRHISGAIIVDDSYNSNPAAVKETLKTFLQIGARKHKIVVLGDMLELGKYTKKSHQELGRLISGLGIDFLIGVGKAAKIMTEEAQKRMGSGRVKVFASRKEVYPFIKRFLKSGNIILIKASRSIGLDKLALRLEKGI